MMVSDKCIIGTVGIICLSILQLYAWYSGHNGTVFALVSAGIGAIIGGFFGNFVNIKKSIKEYMEN